MNKIEEYLNNLEKKHLYMLYVSLIIVVGIIYYNYNYSYLQDKIDTQNTTIYSLEKKLKKTNFLEIKLRKIKKDILKIKKENSALSEDLNYINILIKTSNVLNIDNKKFSDILKDVLNKAINNNIKASYLINENLNDFKSFNINIKGSFNPENYNNFLFFIHDLEDIKQIKEIKTFYMKKDKNIEFKMNIIFWSLR